MVPSSGMLPGLSLGAADKSVLGVKTEPDEDKGKKTKKEKKTRKGGTHEGKGGQKAGYNRKMGSKLSSLSAKVTEIRCLVTNVSTSTTL